MTSRTDGELTYPARNEQWHVQDGDIRIAVLEAALRQIRMLAYMPTISSNFAHEIYGIADDALAGK